MDINAKKGTEIRFSFPGNGYTHHQEQGGKYLEVGEIYTVDHTEVEDWHTDVFLQEIPDVGFNSVMFENVED